MPQQAGYIRWPTNAQIPLTLSLVAVDGTGVVGATPEVSIRRYREYNGTLLDNYFWDGAGFVATPHYFTLSPVDAINNPGGYIYLFEQYLIGLEITYLMHFRNTTAPIGFSEELHQITNEVYIPKSVPEPVVIGPQSVLGQLALMKDGGTGQFDPLADSLHFMNRDTSRILGLLHQNAMVDKQMYDPQSQLVSCRLRVFDSAAHVPATPGGSESLGLTQEYVINAQYSGVGLLSKYTLKRIT